METRLPDTARAGTDKAQQAPAKFARFFVEPGVEDRIGFEYQFATFFLLVLIAGITLSIVKLHEFTNEAYEALPLQGTALQAEMVSNFRQLYSSEVVERVKAFGIRANHQYKDKDRTVPLPATLTMELGERFAASSPGAKIRLYSEYPFPWRKDDHQLDDFEQEALRTLRQQPDQPFYRFEEFEGRASLRYAIADKMQQASCVRCHNSYPDSPKTDWKLGDVRGVLEIIRPLDGNVAASRASQKWVLNTTSILSGLALFGLVVIHSRLWKAKRRLKLAMEATQQISEIKTTLLESKVREMDLSRSKEVAESANQAKSEFLAVMSHELRTPLNGILGMNELLLNTELTEQQRRFMEACSSSGKLLLQLINDILDLSKIEAGKLELNMQACHLESLVFDVIGVFTQSANQKGLALNCYVEPSACVQVLGDENRLRQVLVNLLGNALKFTVSGDVTVRVDVTQRRECQMTNRFSVTDTGLGIPEERRDRLFRPFSQVDSSTTRNYGGTGLGLSICKQLVELMGGQIDVESQVGVGSTFWFELPLEIVQGSPEREDNWQGLRGARVLVVAAPERKHPQIDDCLTAWGCRAEAATSLPEALDALVRAENAGTPFVAVLVNSDFVIFEDAAVLQELVGQGLPTIGWGLSDNEQEAAGVRGLGLRLWLRDPVRPSDLYDVLVTVLSMACAPPLGVALGSATKPSRLEISGHVLVAEDNRINQMYIVELLKQCGCSCDLAATGHEALEAVQHRRYDLVLMDCQMPEMDGLTATREIRRREALQEISRHLPIVALTANALQGDRERCLEAGMDDYLTKPLEAHMLYETLKKTIGTRSEERVVPAAPAQDSSRAITPFDAEGLLTRCFGNLDFAWSLLDEFETSGCERVEAIRRSAEQQDACAVAEAAHALKGAAGILCATSLSKVAARVEALGRSGDIAGIGSLVDELAHELEPNNA